MVVKNSCGQTITQYNVQTGDGANNLNQVAPGASGTVLTSNGVAAQPSFQTISSFAPNSTITIKDDFIGTGYHGITSQVVLTGELSWTSLSSFTFWIQDSTASDSAHPGVLGQIISGVGSICQLFLGFNGAATVVPNVWYLGGGQITINWVFKIVNLSNNTDRYILRMGMGITGTAVDQVDGVYVEYSDDINSGNWNYKTANASTRTTSNSSTAVTTGWHNAQIVINAAASSITYFIDGVSLGAAITTNIPVVGIIPFFQLYVTAGTVVSESIAVDLFYATQTLTAAR